MSIKVVFAGSAEFGALALRSLVESDAFEVQFVLSNPAKPVGRKRELKLPPLAVVAQELGLQIKTPENKEELLKLTKEIPEQDRPDFLVVVAYGMLLPVEILAWPRVAPVNVHGSILPKYRGASPIQSALLHDDWEHVGNSIMQMTKGLDEGPIYWAQKLPTKGTETAGEIFNALSEQAADILPTVLKQIYVGNLKATEQTGEPTFCKKINKADGLVDVKQMTVAQILAKYRAYTPWPGIFYFDEQGRRIILREICSDADVNSRLLANMSLETGKLFSNEENVYLPVNGGFLKLLKVQTEGKLVLSARDWYAGNVNKG